MAPRELKVRLGAPGSLCTRQGENGVHPGLGSPVLRAGAAPGARAAAPTRCPAPFEARAALLASKASPCARQLRLVASSRRGQHCPGPSAATPPLPSCQQSCPLPQQISVAVAIAIVTRQALWHYSGGWRWAPSWWAATSADNVCLMSPGRRALAAQHLQFDLKQSASARHQTAIHAPCPCSVNLCAFTFIVVGVSLAASTLLFITSASFHSGCQHSCPQWHLLVCTQAATWQRQKAGTWPLSQS